MTLAASLSENWPFSARRSNSSPPAKYSNTMCTCPGAVCAQAPARKHLGTGHLGLCLPAFVRPSLCGCLRSSVCSVIFILFFPFPSLPSSSPSFPAHYLPELRICLRRGSCLGDPRAEGSGGEWWWWCGAGEEKGKEEKGRRRRRKVVVVMMCEEGGGRGSSLGIRESREKLLTCTRVLGRDIPSS